MSASISVSQSDANTKAQWNQLAKKYLHNKGNQSSDSSELSADEDWRALDASDVINIT